MNLKYSNAFFAAFLSPIVVVSGFRVGACVDTDAVGAGVDTDAVGAGFEVHPAIPTVANMSKPITRKMTIFLIKKAMYA